MSTTKQSLVGKKSEAIYRPSWVDRLMGEIERLPGQIWMFYLFVFIVITGVTLIFYWLDGTADTRAMLYIITSTGIYTVFPIAMQHYLKNVASKSLHSFHPLLSGNESEYAEYDYLLTVMPARWGWLALIIGIPLAIIEVQTNPADFLISPSTSTALIIYVSIVSTIFAITFFSLLFQSCRQLLTVNAIHKQATNINIFSLSPVYSFSRLSARIGVGLLVIVILLMTEPESGLVNISFFLVLSVISSAAFILPLVGMYTKIRDEKDRMIDQINDRISAMINRIQEQVIANDYSEADDLNKALASLISGREVVDKISPWPWEPGTFRGFISTVILPIVLWLLFRILERYI